MKVDDLCQWRLEIVLEAVVLKEETYCKYSTEVKVGGHRGQGN